MKRVFCERRGGQKSQGSGSSAVRGEGREKGTHRVVVVAPQDPALLLGHLLVARAAARDRGVHVDVVRRKVERDEEHEDEGEARVRRREEAQEARQHASAGAEQCQHPTSDSATAHRARPERARGAELEDAVATPRGSEPETHRSVTMSKMAPNLLVWPSARAATPSTASRRAETQ